MNRPRWRKVLRDLWGNKVRTILVVLSISIGVFAIGMIVGTQTLLSEDLAVAYDGTNPANAILFPDLFDEELVYAVDDVEGVQEVEGRRELTMQLVTGPEETVGANVIALSNYKDMRIHTILPLAGEFPPRDRTVLVERSSLEAAQTAVGETITIETQDGRFRELEVIGTVHDIFTNPVQFTGEPNLYITRDTLEWLGHDPLFDELHIVTDGVGHDADYVRIVADRVEEKVEKAGLTNYFTRVPEENTHPANDAIQPLLAILGALGILSLLASGFLVINIINGLLAQHTTQIGIMKSIGARRSQVIFMYFIAVLIFGLLSLLIAVPLGGLAAYGLTTYLASLVNFDLLGFRIPPQAWLLQIGVAIVVPLIAALVPVLRGASITVRRALSEQGLGGNQFGGSFLDRFVNWISGKILRLSRPLQISVRNTIRRKARLLLTLITLTLGGAIFIGVLSVHASLLTTLDGALAYFNYDVDINFEQSHRIEEIQRVAMQLPDVQVAESWIGASARRVLPDDSENDNFFIIGTNAETEVIQPILLEGRWLEQEDTNALVLNSLILKDDPDIALGDTIHVNIDGRKQDWQVVGIVQGVMTGPIAYANQPYLAREIRFVGKAGGVQILAHEHDRATQEALQESIVEHFESAGLSVGNSSITADIRDQIEYQFNIIVILLAVMATLIAIVGGLGLMGTMSINVLERTREIGVLRAVGASDGSVLRIILVEGVLVGLISWVLGGLVAYPIGQLLSNIVGVQLLESPLVYTFAINGAFYWLGAMLFIAGLASFLPAWNASRYSVRQTLAYE